jgi:hypothetical protein
LRQSDEKKLKRGRKLLALSDFPFRKELEFTLENGWLEQEAWNIKLGGQWPQLLNNRTFE